MNGIRRGSKCVLSNRELGMNAKCLYVGVTVTAALYGAEAWSMRCAESRKVNVLEKKIDKFGRSDTNGQS